MACTNCFNGCAEIISDKCVKYTGPDIPELDISTGDTLLTVENKITEKLITVMDGSGIIPIIDPADVCEVVQELMPCCPPFTLNDILTVFLKSICILNDKNEALKERIILLEAAINTLNADYIIGCLTGVTTTSDTHEIVQAVIDKLCSVAADLATNYVRLDELDELIAEHDANIPDIDKHYNKMLPYIAYPYYGPITDFSASGVGSNLWIKVFLCNGDNGTPDLRGRTMVGATTMQGVIAMDPAVLPGGANPNYTITGANSVAGANSVTLTVGEMPSHTHVPTLLVNELPHTHTVTQRYTYRADFDHDELIVDVDNNSVNNNPLDVIRTTSPTLTGITVTGTNANMGGGNAHTNIQPSRAAYFIMYIP